MLRYDRIDVYSVNLIYMIRNPMSMNAVANFVAKNYHPNTPAVNTAPIPVIDSINNWLSPTWTDETES